MTTYIYKAFKEDGSNATLNKFLSFDYFDKESLS